MIYSRMDRVSIENNGIGAFIKPAIHNIIMKTLFQFLGYISENFPNILHQRKPSRFPYAHNSREKVSLKQ